MYMPILHIAKTRYLPTIKEYVLIEEYIVVKHKNLMSLFIFCIYTLLLSKLWILTRVNKN